MEENKENINVQEDNMQDANVQDASMQNTNVQDTNVQDANVQDTNFQDASMQDTNVQDANVQDGGQVAYIKGIQIVNINPNDPNNPQAAAQAATYNGHISSDTNIAIKGTGSSYSTIRNLKDIFQVATKYNNDIVIKLVQTSLKDKNNNEIKNGSNAIIKDKVLFLSDLLKLTDPNSDISAIFNAIPIAQYKHLPDPSVLKNPPPLPAQGGSNEQIANETSEELPSLYLEESKPTNGGAVRSHKWSSHKKRKSFRIRTKKNKKL